MGKRQVPLRRVTLKQVYDIARWDRAFLAAFLANPKKALAGEGCSLSEKDLANLKKWFKKRHKLMNKKLVQLLMVPMRSKIYPWP